MDYEGKIAEATRLIEEHNQQAGEGSKIDPAAFLIKLKDLGGTSVTTLQECSWEDLQKAGLPPILARVIAKTFRTNGQEERPANRHHVDSMLIPELLGAYDPQDSDSRIGRRLARITNRKRCLVFHPDGQLLCEPSMKLIQELQSGLPELAEFEWRGEIYKTYAVGEQPNRVFNENPLYPGQPLRSGEICARTGLDWTGVPMELRQLFWLAVNRTHEINDPNTAISLWNMDNARWAEPAHLAMARFRQRLRKAAILFDELNATGSLPSLKIKPTAPTGIGGGKRVNL